MTRLYCTSLDNRWAAGIHEGEYLVLTRAEPCQRWEIYDGAESKEDAIECMLCSASTRAEDAALAKWQAYTDRQLLQMAREEGIPALVERLDNEVGPVHNEEHGADIRHHIWAITRVTGHHQILKDGQMFRVPAFGKWRGRDNFPFEGYVFTLAGYAAKHNYGPKEIQDWLERGQQPVDSIGRTTAICDNVELMRANNASWDKATVLLEGEVVEVDGKLYRVQVRGRFSNPVAFVPFGEVE